MERTPNQLRWRTGGLRLLPQISEPPSDRVRMRLRVAATCSAVLLLPPFLLLAVAPMLLFLIPVAVVAIPFIIPALLRGSIAAHQAERRRTRLRIVARPRLVLS
jgi:hypothetical protein